MNSIKRLWHDLRVLGWPNGLHYWIIERRAQRNPDIALQWAESCIKEGNRQAILGKHDWAACYWGWAEKLKESHANYTVAQFDKTFHISERPTNP